jgi:hypothetical protein
LKRKTKALKKIGGCRQIPNQTKWFQLWTINLFSRRRKRSEEKQSSLSSTTADEIYLHPLDLAIINFHTLLTLILKKNIFRDFYLRLIKDLKFY